jgi:hypothetical protein
VWKAQFDFRKTNKKDVPFPNIRFAAGDVIPDESKPFICLNTNPNGGGSKYGGWREEAWDRFLTLKKEITTDRVLADVNVLEHAVMEAIRVKDDITQTNLAEYLLAKKKRKSVVTPGPAERAGMMDEE